MKVFECCPFYNENLIAEIKMQENKNWMDRLYITECNRTFKNTKKEFNFKYSEDEFISYQKLDGSKLFKPDGWHLSKRVPFIRYKKMHWYNDGLQRNLACSYIDKRKLSDDDIVILSDIDEIIDSRYADDIIGLVKKHDIITIKIHFSLFYFNLFSTNWSGAEDYSYRIFIMNGKYFKNCKLKSDQLRKLGEQGKLKNEVYCPDKFMGFHHSWIGDENFLFDKLNSYAHEPEDHNEEIFNKEKNEYDIQKIKECLKQQKSIFPEHELVVRNDVDFLRSLETNHEARKFFL